MEAFGRGSLLWLLGKTLIINQMHTSCYQTIGVPTPTCSIPGTMPILRTHPNQGTQNPQATTLNASNAAAAIVRPPPPATTLVLTDLLLPVNRPAFACSPPTLKRPGQRSQPAPEGYPSFPSPHGSASALSLSLSYAGSPFALHPFAKQRDASKKTGVAVLLPCLFLYFWQNPGALKHFKGGKISQEERSTRPTLGPVETRPGGPVALQEWRGATPPTHFRRKSLELCLPQGHNCVPQTIRKPLELFCAKMYMAGVS